MAARIVPTPRTAGLVALLLTCALDASCASTTTTAARPDCRVQCDPSGPDGAGCGPCRASADGDHAMTVATRAAFDLQRALAPLLALPRGPGRDREVCARASVIRDRARALSEGPVPTPYRFHEYDWSAQADRLLAQADALLTVCTVPPAPSVDDMTGAVRAAFEAIAARLGLEALPAR